MAPKCLDNTVLRNTSIVPALTISTHVLGVTFDGALILMTRGCTGWQSSEPAGPKG